MSDLISRSAVLKKFEEMNAKGTSDLWHITGIKAIIENQPTAYNVDKVVEKLEKELKIAEEEKSRCASDFPYWFSVKGYVNGLYNALAEVKEVGGIE